MSWIYDPSKTALKKIKKNVLKRSFVRSWYKMTNLALQLYIQVCEKLVGKFQNFLAVPSNLWSSHTQYHCLSVTIHFIYDYKLCSACLQTNYLPEEDSGKVIAWDLMEMHECWDLWEENMTGSTAKALELNKGNLDAALWAIHHVKHGTHTQQKKMISIGTIYFYSYSTDTYCKSALYTIH